LKRPVEAGKRPVEVGKRPFFYKIKKLKFYFIVDKLPPVWRRQL